MKEQSFQKMVLGRLDFHKKKKNEVRLLPCTTKKNELEIDQRPTEQKLKLLEENTV